jgi:hypothetical protein
MIWGTSASATASSSNDPVGFFIDAEGVMFVTFPLYLGAFSWAYGFEVWYK